MLKKYLERKSILKALQEWRDAISKRIRLGKINPDTSLYLPSNISNSDISEEVFIPPPDVTPPEEGGMKEPQIPPALRKLFPRSP